MDWRSVISVVGPWLMVILASSIGRAQERAWVSHEKQEAERQVARGCLAGTIVQLETQYTQEGGMLHEFVVFDTGGGAYVRADLGPIGALKGHAVGPGDQIRIEGTRLTLGPPRLLTVDRVEINGRSIHLNRPPAGRPWSPSQPRAPAKSSVTATRPKQKTASTGSPSAPVVPANGHDYRYGGTFRGTYAYDKDMGYDYGQWDDNAQERPYFQRPGHAYFDAPKMQDRPVMPARAWDESGDAYYDAFLFSGGPEDYFPHEEYYGPGYDAYYYRGVYGRFCPIDYGYQPYTKTTFSLDY